MAVGAYFLVHLNDEIRHEVQRLLARQYPHLDVRVRDARLIEGRGIEIRDLSLRERNSAPGAPPLVEVEEVFLACPVQIKELLHGLPPLTQVVFHRPHLRAARRSDGSWSVEQLLPLPEAGKGPVEVIVKKGILELSGNSSGHAATVVLREISGAFRPSGPSSSSQREAGRDFLFAVTAATPLCRQLKLSGRCDLEQRVVRFGGRLDGLSLSADDFAWLPAPLAKAAEGLEQLRGTIHLEQVEVRSPADTVPQVAAKVRCEEVEIRHDRLPDPITGLSGELEYRDGVLHSPRLAASFGSASVEVSFRRHGWAGDSPFVLSGTMTGLNLRQRHWLALPASLREVWEKYHAEGLIDVTRCDMTYDGRHLLPHVEVQCRDVAVVSEKFPYPLRRVRGTATMDAAADPQAELADVRLRLVGEATSQSPVAIEGEFSIDTGLTRFRGHPVGSLRIEGRGIVVDEPFLAALPDGPQRFIRELQADGRFDVVWRSWRTDPAQVESEKQLDVTLQGGSVRYVRFPYPLQIVGGRVQAARGSWEFINLAARNGEAAVVCNGSLRPPGAAAGPAAAPGPVLTLRFEANRLELDSTLRHAVATLTPDAQLAWEMLEPTGRVDSTVQYRHVLGSGPPDIEHLVEPIEKSVSIRPKFFPYRLDEVEGRVHFGPTTATFERMRGQHGPTTVVADGTFQKVPTGAWALQLDDLAVDRLIVEKELLAALPEGLSRLVARLSPSGQINIGDSSVRVSRAAPGDPLSTNWRLNFDVHQASLDCGVQLDNLSGGIKLAGHGQGGEFTTDGELSLDSVRWKGFFASNVSGPLYADATQVLLGRHACLARSIPPRRITADAYGGKVTGDAVATVGPPSRFSLAAEYQAGDLRRLITETWPTREHVRGEIYGRLNLQGMSGSPETFMGTGAVALQNAELYELPQLIRLFKVLRMHEPDRTAFTRADAQFKISGSHLVIRDLELTGDAVALHGGGTVTFDQRLNLTFFSELAPSDAPLPALRSLMRQASKQVVRLHVQGTIADPRFYSEPLPWLNDGLQQIQQELGPPPREVAREPGQERGARNWLGPLWR